MNTSSVGLTNRDLRSVVLTRTRQGAPWRRPTSCVLSTAVSVEQSTTSILSLCMRYQILDLPRSCGQMFLQEIGKRRPSERRHWYNITRSYDELAGDECGRVELAGASVAVPFVGTTAASFVLAEVLRLFHGGPAYTDLKLRLSVPGDMRPLSAGRYSAHDAVLPFVCST